MHVDAQSQRDLLLLTDRNGAPGLFAHLDRTTTADGCARLRERFRQPLRDVAEIRATQESVHFAMRHADWFRAGVEATTAAAVERYMASPIEPVAAESGMGAVVERAWVGARYPELVALARTGVPAAALMLRSLATIAAAILREGPPPLLRALAAEGASLLDAAPLRPFLAFGGDRPGTTRALALDAVLRGPARESLRRARAILAELDAIGAMATVTRELGLVRPEVLDDDAPPHLELHGVWHPFVSEPVPNDLALGGDRRLLFLTGPNMAGKTTYLRAAGVALFLAHLGMGVPAAAMRFTPIDALVTSLGTEDDVRLGYSYFYAEVRRVREIAGLLAEGRRCVVLVDEVFKGTNVMDALDASRLVLRGFARRGNALFVVSSHLAELADELAAEPGVALACFEGRLEDGRATYDYRVRDGVSAQRMGLVLLEEAGVTRLLGT